MIDIDDTMRSDLRHAVISGVVAAVIGTLMTMFVLDWYVTLTVSVISDPQLYSTLMSGGVRAAGFASFFSGFFAAFFARRNLRGHS